MDCSRFAPTPSTDRGDDAIDVVERIVELVCELLPEIVEADRRRVTAIRRVIRQEFAGGRVYVAKRAAVTRREQVLELFNGRNASEVARQLGISRATVYRLLKQPGR